MVKKICSLCSTLLIIFLAVVAALLVVPNLIGMKCLAVLSGSMEPGIPVGSIVYVKETEPEALEAGDVITYQLSQDTMVTHRVVSVDTDGETVITKGDANEVEDASPIAFNHIVGKEEAHIPYLGYISIYMKTPIGIAVCCGLLIMIILFAFLPDIFTAEETSEKELVEK